MKKGLCLLFMIVMVITICGCQFSEHGDIYHDETRWTQSGDTYSFMGMLETNGSIQFSRFSGLFTLKRWQQLESFTLTLDMDITQGQFQCFLVTEDNDILLLDEGNNYVASHEGFYRLRIVANEAKGQLTYTIN
jgi:hypothetical protein